MSPLGELSEPGTVTVAKLCVAGRLDPMPLISQVLPAGEAGSAGSPIGQPPIDQPPGDLPQVVLDFRRDTV